MIVNTIEFEGAPVDQREVRNVLGRFATGVTTIRTPTPLGKLERMTANSYPVPGTGKPFTPLCQPAPGQIRKNLVSRPWRLPPNRGRHPAQLECVIEKTIPAVDHQIILERALSAGYDDAAQPLLFSAGGYVIAAPLPNIQATADLATLWDELE